MRLLGPAPRRVISCAFRVANSPGHGFVEQPSAKALAHEMRKCGFGAVQQRGTVVLCDGVIVGEYTAGLPVEDQVIAELKVVAPLSDEHRPQSRNDLRAMGQSLRLLINFGRPKVEIRRVTPLRVPSSLTRVLARPSLIARTIPFHPCLSR
jgi:GxxExxY protein